MATVNLFYDPVFRDGAFTRTTVTFARTALQKTMKAMELGAELGANVFVLWGGREGVETTLVAARPMRSNAFAKRSIGCASFLKVKNSTIVSRSRRSRTSARRHLLPTTGAYLGFIATLDRPDLVGVNPEVAHEHMAGLNMTHARGPGVGGGKTLSHRSQRSDPRPLRSGPAFRFGQSQSRVLAGQVSRRRRLQRLAPLRCARVSHGGLRWRQRVCEGLRADLPDTERKGGPMERDQEIKQILSEIDSTDVPTGDLLNRTTIERRYRRRV